MYDMVVVGGPGCVKSMLILLKMVYVCFKMNCFLVESFKLSFLDLHEAEFRSIPGGRVCECD